MHDGGSPKFECSVLKSFRDPLSCQIYKGVAIRKAGEMALNPKKNFYQMATYNVESSVVHGWEIQFFNDEKSANSINKFNSLIND